MSVSPYESLNIGFSTDDDNANVRRNRELIAEGLEVSLDRWVVPGQVHGADVLLASARTAGEGANAPCGLRGDALFLPEPGVFGFALSADCPLVAVVDPTRKSAGVAHAGWRGTAAGVVENLIGSFVDHGSTPGSLWAAISPGICAACYPVGDEVFESLAHVIAGTELDRASDNAARAGEGGGTPLDLRGVHERILRSLGVKQIERSTLCSACSTIDGSTEPRFFSHRRDHGTTGRNGALVGWRC